MKREFVNIDEKIVEVENNELDLSGFGISNILCIEKLDEITVLEKLTLANNKITEIEGLDNLGNLKELYIRYNNLKEIKGLDKLTNLQILMLHDNNIQEIKGLNNLKKLEKLWLYNNEIEEINGLSELTNLQKLSISKNKIKEINGLDKLTNLQSLYLGGNYIEEINGLDKLTNLQMLRLDNNYIKEINGLENLNKLQELNLARNKISEISGLDMLENLQFLDLAHNNIIEIKGLENLTVLQKIALNQNPIIKEEKYLIKKSRIRRKFEKLKKLRKNKASSIVKYSQDKKQRNKKIREILEHGTFSNEPIDKTLMVSKFNLSMNDAEDYCNLLNYPLKYSSFEKAEKVRLKEIAEEVLSEFKNYSYQRISLHFLTNIMNFNLIIAKKIGTLLKEEDFIPHFPLCSKNKEKNVFINNIDAYWTPVGPITRVSFIINVCNEDNTQKSLFIMHDAGEENNISPKFSVDSQKFGNITIHKNFTRAFNLRRKPNYEISFFLLSSNNKTIIPNSEYKISISLNKTKTDIAVGVGKQVFKVLVKLIK